MSYKISKNCTFEYKIKNASEKSDDDTYYDMLELIITHDGTIYKFATPHTKDHLDEVNKFMKSQKKVKRLYLHICNGGPTIEIKDGYLTMWLSFEDTSFEVGLKLDE